MPHPSGASALVQAKLGVSHYTVFDQAVVDEFNTQVVYGFNGWALNVPKDVTGHKYLPTIEAVAGASGQSLDSHLIVPAW